MSINKYKLTIGEPWDFIGIDGQNIILGTIIKEIDVKTLIFEAYNEQTFNEGKGKFFILKARYYQEQLVSNGEYGGIVNGYLILSSLFKKPIEELLKTSKQVIIGGLHKI